MRRLVLSIAPFLLLHATTLFLTVLGDDLQVFPKPPGTSTLRAALEQDARERLRRRHEEVVKLKTPEQIQERARNLRSWLLGSLGAFPERAPLNPRVTGKLQGEGVRVEKVVFESRPNHHVTAVLYLPENARGPVPGVLVPCGHSANGKAAETYQRASILLAKNGMAALCYDPVGQGERLQLIDDAGKSPLPGSTTEHSLSTIGSILVGRQLAHYRIWDGIRAMDYLASRPEVDPKRLGCTGNSGGGTLTAYLMAIDDRIAVAAPSCYLTTLDRLFSTIGPQDGEQNITGQVAAGFDHADFITLRAPRPTLMCVATRDFFDIDGAWTTFREAKRLYGQLGYGERVELFEYDDTHGFSKPRREAAMRWLRRWLLKLDDSPSESSFPIFTDQDLQVTQSGQVLKDFPGELSLFDINGRQAEALSATRKARTGSLSKSDFRKLVADTIQIGVRDQRITFQKKANIERNGATIQTGLVRTGKVLDLPVRIVRPVSKSNETSPILVRLGADARDWVLIEKDIQAGKTVVLVNLPGLGELGPASPANPRQKSYFGGLEREAFLALHLNQNLVGWRVRGLLDTLDALGTEIQGRDIKFQVFARGDAGVPAWIAAALDDRIVSTEIQGSVRSLVEVAGARMSRGQLANAIPGVLASFDLPDLNPLIAPRTLETRSPVDPAGNPIP